LDPRGSGTKIVYCVSCDADFEDRALLKIHTNDSEFLKKHPVSYKEELGPVYFAKSITLHLSGALIVVGRTTVPGMRYENEHVTVLFSDGCRDVTVLRGELTERIAI